MPKAIKKIHHTVTRPNALALLFAMATQYFIYTVPNNTELLLPLAFCIAKSDDISGIDVQLFLHSSTSELMYFPHNTRYLQIVSLGSHTP